MKANELRLGNWIYNGIGEPFQANGETINNFDVGQAILGEFKPIPLDEEWMLKLGFEKLPELNYKRGILSINLWPIDRSLTQTTKAHGLIKVGDCLLMDHTIKYVHQLQNLYHSLTGEELELK